MYYNFSKKDIQNSLSYWENVIKADTLCIYSSIDLTTNTPYLAIYVGAIEKFNESKSVIGKSCKLVKTIPMSKFYKMTPELVWRELEIELKILDANTDFI